MGHALSMLQETWPPKSKFTIDHIPDLSGKVVIVTGANTGVGKETVKALLIHNAKVYIAARNRDRASAAIADLLKQTGKEAHFLELDLASLRSVRAAAEDFTSKEKELHILFNNAGVMMTPIDQITADGYDLQMGTNVLGHFYFTKLLTPTLISTAENTPDKKARVITTSSSLHLLQNLDFNTFKDGPARKEMGSKKLYFQSKFGNVVFGAELARRHGEDGIVSISVDPGNLHSDLQRHLTKIECLFLSMILYPTAQGALTQLWGGTSPECSDFNGMYLVPWARVGKPHADALDPQAGKQLWDWLEEQVANINA